MSFENTLRGNYVRIVKVDTIRAKSLIKSSKQAIETAKIIPLKETSLKTIFREIYEGLRENCDALGFVKGYKFSNHKAITYFLRDILNEKSISSQFERYRKLRNGINYYGNDIEIKTVEEALKDIPLIIRKLKKYMDLN